MDSTVPYEVLLKILLIGDAGANKTELLQKYVGEIPGVEESLGPTLGLDYRLKDVVYKGKRIKLQLWDTAGQERFRSVTSSYYRGSHGSLLVFNVAKNSSFGGLSYWLDEIKTNAPSNFQTILVATGIDEEGTEMQLEVARAFAKEKALILKEVNLQNEAQVHEVFDTVIDKIMTNSGRNSLNNNESIILDKTPLTERPPRCLC